MMKKMAMTSLAVLSLILSGCAHSEVSAASAVSNSPAPASQTPASVSSSPSAAPASNSTAPVSDSTTPVSDSTKPSTSASASTSASTSVDLEAVYQVTPALLKDAFDSNKHTNETVSYAEKAEPASTDSLSKRTMTFAGKEVQVAVDTDADNDTFNGTVLDYKRGITTEKGEGYGMIQVSKDATDFTTLLDNDVELVDSEINPNDIAGFLNSEMEGAYSGIFIDTLMAWDTAKTADQILADFSYDKATHSYLQTFTADGYSVTFQAFFEANVLKKITQLSNSVLPGEHGTYHEFSYSAIGTSAIAYKTGEKEALDKAIEDGFWGKGDFSETGMDYAKSVHIVRKDYAQDEETLKRRITSDINGGNGRMVDETMASDGTTVSTSTTYIVKVTTDDKYALIGYPTASGVSSSSRTVDAQVFGPAAVEADKTVVGVVTTESTIDTVFFYNVIDQGETLVSRYDAVNKNYVDTDTEGTVTTKKLVHFFMGDKISDQLTLTDTDASVTHDVYYTDIEYTDWTNTDVTFTTEETAALNAAIAAIA
jgi:hypothetical protein